MSHTELSVFELVGGEPTFRALVDHFYARVEQDDVLRPLFPEDLELGKYWQYLFLMQYWGGPTQYAAERGHPRLRMRHAPFQIDAEARNHWVEHMLAAIDEVGIQEPARSMMRDYFERGASFMINHIVPDSSAGGE
ncbi:globin [Phototrophicus methaneseepsis]|uniref:Globin n=1 Tax=Phototrophicus methaneseepsis TaxID=2710758 RepID=A0A7S8E671_9CHLR|nr:globin [Phototrophicus methaneseepsis]QPC81111.1 globin [Phototrophicus methaneseepsis]